MKKSIINGISRFSHMAKQQLSQLDSSPKLAKRTTLTGDHFKEILILIKVMRLRLSEHFELFKPGHFKSGLSTLPLCHLHLSHRQNTSQIKRPK